MRCIVWAACLLSVMALRANAVDRFWTGAADTNFYNDANWDTLAPQGGADVATIDNGGQAVIAADSGARALSRIILGTVVDAGHLVQDGGTMTVSGPRSYVGSATAEGIGPSSWILNGNTVVLYDDPTGASNNGLGSDGVLGEDLEIAANGASGNLEVHDNAVLRISDDLKIAAEGSGGTGTVLVDGNAQVSIGSGLSVTEGGATATLTVAGNATVISGNSAGPGRSDIGRTDEGYLTLSVNAASNATLNVRDSGNLYARTLQQRNGVSIVNIEGNGQLHIFDVFQHAAPDLGNATVEGSAQASERSSNISEAGTAETNITITGNGKFSVDSAPADATFSGFAMSGGTNRGGNSAGGTSVVSVADNGSFQVAQDLHVGMGNGATTNATLKVTGPSATVSVGGDLRFALQPDFEPSPGVGILHAVITAANHSTVTVGGIAELGLADLIVEFSGYNPRGGESYTLISASSIPDDFFSSTLPTLPDGLTWAAPAFGDGNYVLSIDGSLGPACDLNGDGNVDAADAGLMFADWGANPGSPANKNGDGFVDAADAGVMFSQWTGDPGPVTEGNVAAEYNPGTGELKLSSNGVINVFVQSASGAITPLSPAPPAPVGLLTNNANRVGITNLGPINTENFSFGSIGAGLAKDDLSLIYTVGFGQQAKSIPAGTGSFYYIPEPASFGLIGLGLAGLLAARRRS